MMLPRYLRHDAILGTDQNRAFIVTVFEHCLAPVDAGFAGPCGGEVARTTLLATGGRAPVFPKDKKVWSGMV